MYGLPPARYIDPNGDIPWLIAGAKGALQEYGFQVAENLIDGKGLESFTDIDLQAVGESAAFDAATVGIGGMAKAAARTARLVEKARNVSKSTEKVKDGVKSPTVLKNGSRPNSNESTIPARKGAFREAKRDLGIPMSQ